MNKYLKDDCAEIQVFRIFRAWIHTAQLPNNFVIKNEDVILKDFNKALEKAFVRLFEGGRINSLSDYNQAKGVGFIEGFVSANLGVTWSYDYKLPYEEDYLRCKSIIELIRVLEFEEIKALKFNNAMTELMSNIHSNINFEFQSFDYLNETKKYYVTKLSDLLTQYKTINVPSDIISEELEKIDFSKIFKENILD